jgi:hypothetical protein
LQYESKKALHTSGSRRKIKGKKSATTKNWQGPKRENDQPNGNLKENDAKHVSANSEIQTLRSLLVCDNRSQPLDEIKSLS